MQHLFPLLITYLLAGINHLYQKHWAGQVEDVFGVLSYQTLAGPHQPSQLNTTHLTDRIPKIL